MTYKYNNVYLDEVSTVVGPYEARGLLGDKFDKSYKDLYNGETYGITKNVDSSIENKIKNVEQYIFIKKVDKQDVSDLFKEEYNVVALTKKLNVIARFFSTNKTWIDEISEEEVAAYIKNKTNK